MFDTRDGAPDERTRQLLMLCALPDVAGRQWNVIARQAMQPRGIEALLGGRVSERHRAASSLQANLADAADQLDRGRSVVEEHLEQAATVGARLVTVLDDDFPRSLRTIRDVPPFLFILGELSDVPSIAIVGTRKASPDGRKRATRLAREVAEAGLGVVSGMAAGIDTAAHRGTLDAGGWTAAVMGTGILRCYPKENQALKTEIADHGAVLSQFWPDQPPGRATFPMRNVAISGMSHATVVIEASESSGASLQARIAKGQGRPLFVLRSLVEAQTWAAKLVAEGTARVLSDPAVAVEAATAAHDAIAADGEQLSLEN